jgi:hypothetical protein
MEGFFHIQLAEAGPTVADLAARIAGGVTE